MGLNLEFFRGFCKNFEGNVALGNMKKTFEVDENLEG